MYERRRREEEKRAEIHHEPTWSVLPPCFFASSTMSCAFRHSPTDRSPFALIVPNSMSDSDCRRFISFCRPFWLAAMCSHVSTNLSSAVHAPSAPGTPRAASKVSRKAAM